MNWWGFWNHGGNWLIFTLCFFVVEGVAIYTKHYTLSETFWLLLKHHRVIAVLSLVVGLTCLIGHFLADWWRKGSGHDER